MEEERLDKKRKKMDDGDVRHGDDRMNPENEESSREFVDSASISDGMKAGQSKEFRRDDQEDEGSPIGNLDDRSESSHAAMESRREDDAGSHSDGQEADADEIHGERGGDSISMGGYRDKQEHEAPIGDHGPDDRESGPYMSGYGPDDREMPPYPDMGDVDPGTEPSFRGSRNLLSRKSGPKSGKENAAERKEPEDLGIRIGPVTSPKEEKESETAEELLSRYAEALKAWRSGKTFAEDADSVESVKKTRLNLARRIKNHTGIANIEISDRIGRYLDADARYLDRPEPSSTRWVDYQERVEKLRKELFSDIQGDSESVGKAEKVRDMIFSAEEYGKVSSRISSLIRHEKEIERQLDYISIRREAALFHFNNHRFVASLGGLEGGSYVDEFLVDVDRRDLGEKHAKLVSEKRAQEFVREAHKRFPDLGLRNGRGDDEAAPLEAGDKIRRFKELREIGKSVKHDHAALVSIGRDFSGNERKFGFLMAALDGEKCNEGILADWMKGLGKEERRKVATDKYAFFSKAKERFIDDFDKVVEGGAGKDEIRNLSRSFAVLEYASRSFMKEKGGIFTLGELNKNDNALGEDNFKILSSFSDSFRKTTAVSLQKAFDRRIDEEAISMRESIDLAESRKKKRADSSPESGHGKEENTQAERPENRSDEASRSSSLNPRSSQGERSGKARTEDSVQVQEAGSKKQKGEEASSGKDSASAQEKGDAQEDATSFMAIRGKGEKVLVSVPKEACASLAFEVHDAQNLKISIPTGKRGETETFLVKIAGMSAPSWKEGEEKRGREAMEEAREHLEYLVAPYVGGDARNKLEMEIVRDENGKPVSTRVRLPSGENLAQRMIRDGYALPDKDDPEGWTRREYLAKQAEANERGLWADGFPQRSVRWRSETQLPNIDWSDRRKRLTTIVGLSMPVSRDGVKAKLMHAETRIFALPLRKWAASPEIDKEIEEVMSLNPGIIVGAYKRNMKILEDLRKRKDSLTFREKIAHDRLSLGRRALGRAMVNHGVLSEEEFIKGSHPMMSKIGIKEGLDKLRPVGRFGVQVTDTAINVTQKAARKAPGFLAQALDALDER